MSYVCSGAVTRLRPRMCFDMTDRLPSGLTASRPPRVSLDSCEQGLRRSDPEALAALYEHLREPLFRYLCRFVERDDAYDLLQDLFLILWERRRTLRFRSGVRPFLYRSARNLALNRKRRADRSVPGLVPDVPDPVNGALEFEARMLSARMAVWIDALPPRRAEAFRLSRHHGLSHDEIASVMGLSKRTVQTHIVHALRDLRSKLDAWRTPERELS